MKKFLVTTSNRLLLRSLFYSVLLSVCFVACEKNDFPHLGNDASRYSSEVIDKWMTLQLRLMRNATGIPATYFSRYFAYSGIAAFESLAPGTSFGKYQGEKWNGLTTLPQPGKEKKYFWPASVNTALASMNRSFFTTAAGNDKAAIDSLEKALNDAFLSAEKASIVAQSNNFGMAVANAVFNWSETDGYKNADPPYTPPVGPGLWVPTPPAFAPAFQPGWSNLRPVVKGSGDNTQPGPPVAYSEDPKSAFYQMVKQVYDASQTLTPDQTEMAIFWRDVPGVTFGGHWLSILQQVIRQTGAKLDKSAFAYAVTGACNNDAYISCFQTKYRYNLVRPITYIRDVFGYASWTSLLTTPAHPEYTSAHAALSAAPADALKAIFGNIGSFTDHTYDYLGFAPRTYHSFGAIAEDAGNSRFYAGIHYLPSIDAGLIQGRKVTENILRKLKLHNR